MIGKQELETFKRGAEKELERYKKVKWQRGRGYADPKSLIIRPDLPEPQNPETDYAIAIRFRSDVAEIVEQFGEKVNEIIPSVFPKRDAVHIALCEVASSNVGNLEALTKLMEHLEVNNIDFKQWMYNGAGVIAPVEPSKEILATYRAVEGKIASISGDEVKIGPTYMPYIQVARFRQEPSREKAAEFFQLLGTSPSIRHNLRLVKSSSVEVARYRVSSAGMHYETIKSDAPC